MIVNQDSIQLVVSQNQRQTGAKGPLSARLNLDFTNQNLFELDMQNAQALKKFDLCQTLYIDNAAGGAAVEVEIPASGQFITAKAGSQGYYNVICPNPIKMFFRSAGGSRVTVFLINAAIPGSVWSAI